MESYGLNMKGELKIENLDTLPVWNSTDERRIVYARDTSNYYVGSNTEWVLLSESYRTYYIDSSTIVPNTSAGCSDLSTAEYGNSTHINMDYLAFDSGSIKEKAQFKYPMSEMWDRGTIKVKFYWSSDTGSTTGDIVEWGIRARALSDGDDLATSFGTAVVISDTLLADNGTKLQITDSTPELTVGGTPALSDVILFEVYRNTDGTDNMIEDAWLFGIWLQYKVLEPVSSW